MKTINREEAIKKLLENEWDTIKQMVDNNDASYVDDIMSQGFKGYSNFENESLAIELSAQFGETYQVIGE